MSAEIVIEAQNGGALVATLHLDRLEMMNARGVQSEITKSLESAPPALILDMTRVGFIDSSGIGILVSLHKQTKGYGGTFILAALSKQAKGVLEITKMDQLFTITESVDDALSKI